MFTEFVNRQENQPTQRKENHCNYCKNDYDITYLKQGEQIACENCIKEYIKENSTYEMALEYLSNKKWKEWFAVWCSDIINDFMTTGYIMTQIELQSELVDYVMSDFEPYRRFFIEEKELKELEI